MGIGYCITLNVKQIVETGIGHNSVMKKVYSEILMNEILTYPQLKYIKISKQEGYTDLTGILAFLWLKSWYLNHKNELGN